MEPRRGHLKRFALAVALVAAFAGTVVASGPAASFNDSNPCPADGPLLICPGGVVGTNYSVQLLGIGGCDLYRWEIVNGALPAGLSMSSSGLISGTPTGAGRSQFWVIIHDLTKEEGGYEWCGGDNQSEREFAITIDGRFRIDNEKVDPGTVGVSYSQALSASVVTSLNPPSGTPVAATWTVQSGTLPPGLTLSPAGVLAGTPTTEGTYQFVVQAQNGAQNDTETLTAVIRQPLLITSSIGLAAPPKSEIGVPFSATFSATGGDGTFTWALASGSLPAGVLFGPEGTISGTPEVAGRFPFVVSVTDGEARTTTFSSTLVVAQRLAVRTVRLRAGKVGRLYRAKVTTLGGVAPVTWKIKGRLPKGVRFASRLGVFTGKPKKAGTYRVTVEATDGLKVKAKKTFVIVVLG